eukprot:1375307-Rhodomonas_salina.1
MDGALQFSLNPLVSGMIQYDVVLQDFGAVDGTSILSEVRRFSIQILPVNSAPSFALLGDVVVNEDSASYEQ